MSFLQFESTNFFPYSILHTNIKNILTLQLNQISYYKFPNSRCSWKFFSYLYVHIPTPTFYIWLWRSEIIIYKLFRRKKCLKVLPNTFFLPKKMLKEGFRVYLNYETNFLLNMEPVMETQIWFQSSCYSSWWVVEILHTLCCINKNFPDLKKSLLLFTPLYGLESSWRQRLWILV